MGTSLASIKAQFDLHTRLFSNATEGITDGEANTRKSDHVNHIKWIAGHLLNTRLNSFARIVGRPPDETYAAHFGRGMALDPQAQYPPISELTAKWKEIGASMSDELSKVPDEVLTAKSQAQVPIGDDTVHGLLSFLVSHESYHIGQLGLLRKMIGKEPMSYN
jgi:uncharacterized damage-inducible protein DinB